MRIVLVVLAFLSAVLQVGAADMVFSRITAADGLSDNQVRYIQQLADGRMVFTTSGSVNLYDGTTFTALHRHGDDVVGLPGYDGYYRIYNVGDTALWVKDYGRLMHIDLTTEEYKVPEVEAENFYVDSEGRIWIQKGANVVCGNSAIPVRGVLQDVDAIGDSIYIFYHSGLVRVHDASDGVLLYERRAYAESDSADYTRTSLIIRHGHGFYQVRNGRRGGLVLYLDAQTRTWEHVFSADYAFNTLAVARDGKSAVLTCHKGVLLIDLVGDSIEHIPTLETREGAVLATEVSTAFMDSSGGLWLGTINSGLLYYHPSRNKLRLLPRESLPSDLRFNGSDSLLDRRGRLWRASADGLEIIQNGTHRVLYTADGLCNNFIQSLVEGPDGSVWVGTGHGISAVRIAADGSVSFTNYLEPQGAVSCEYSRGEAAADTAGNLWFGSEEGLSVYSPGVEDTTNILTPLFTSFAVKGEPVKLDKAPPYVRQITVRYDCNYLTFGYSALNYLNPHGSYFRYRLKGLDSGWTNIYGRELRAVYTNLSPGQYTLEVMVSDNRLEWPGPVASLSVTVLAPWWRTTGAYVAYALIAGLLIGAVVWTYSFVTRRRLELRHREELLLARIRGLIEQVDAYEVEHRAQHPISPADAVDASDSEFITRAVAMVEQNLNTPGYSVERLARDLCMERTGLYRKLVATLDRSPSLFIRDIRLRRAAQLLAEGKMSVGEIAEVTGFSSSSYFSKCFQEVYGCKPSEYGSGC